MSAFSGPLLRFAVVALVGWATWVPLRAQNGAASRREAIEQVYPVMIAALEAKNFGRARNLCDQVILWEPQNPVHHYNLACIEAQSGGTRLPFALGALELAIALGFDDVDHLKTDPDLVPIRGDPKFADLLLKATHNASAEAALAAIAIPDPPAKPRSAPAPEVVFEKPPPAAFQQGVPVGLYFMTRFQASPRLVEKTAWYFAPDGTVYRNLARGFSQADLAAHPGPRGVATASGRTLMVTWANGQKSSADLEREGRGFTWDMGIFSAVTAFDDLSDAAGNYAGEESTAAGGDPGMGANQLELRADGTFAWPGMGFDGAASPPDRLQAGASHSSKGQWKLNGYSLILTDDKGAVVRGLVFPIDDEKTVVKPDWMFFDGMMYKRRP